LPAEFCHEGFAGSSSQQRLFREWIGLCREESAHGNVVVSGSDNACASGEHNISDPEERASPPFVAQEMQ
jgi:hypothetical protein